MILVAVLPYEHKIHPMGIGAIGDLAFNFAFSTLDRHYRRKPKMIVISPETKPDPERFKFRD